MICVILATISFAFLETCGTGPAIQYPCEAPWQASPAVANHHQTPLTVLAAHLNFLTYSYISLYLQLPLPPNTPSFLTIPQLIHHPHPQGGPGASRHPRRPQRPARPPGRHGALPAAPAAARGAGGVAEEMAGGVDTAATDQLESGGKGETWEDT